MIDNELIEAKRTPGHLVETKGERVLVRKAMIKHFENICNAIDQDLAAIPRILKQYGLKEFDGEALQRAILKDGFQAVDDVVFTNTVNNLKKAGLYPGMQKRLARENADALPNRAELQIEIDNAVGSIKGGLSRLDVQIDPDSLVFRSGSLCLPKDYVKSVALRYTLPVTEEDIKTVEKIRQAGLLLAELKRNGIQVADEMRIPPAGGHPVLAPGLITRIASGAEYTDDELVGVLLGINLTR